MAQRGLLDAEKEDPFSLFVSSTNIRYCYYHDTQNILGNTFGMCVLQVGRPPAPSASLSLSAPPGGRRAPAHEPHPHLSAPLLPRRPAAAGL
jgi:N-acetyltransferase 10